MKSKNLQVLMNDISNWSDSEFGEHRSPITMLHHLKKEVPELIESISEFTKAQFDTSVSLDEFAIKRKNASMEYADCLMLLLDSASHFHMNADQLLATVKEKLEINKKREWGEPDKNGVVEHIRN